MPTAPTVDPPPPPPPTAVATAEPAADVKVVESVSTTTYAVSGSSGSELRSSLNASGPVAVDDNRRYDAVTNWSMQWSFRMRNDGVACTLTTATIQITITTVLPELSSPDDLSTDLLARWQRYLDALRGHESGHVARELDGARTLKSLLEQTPPAPTCPELGRQLNVLGEDEVDKIRASDSAYDVETRHGRTQGAVFP